MGDLGMNKGLYRTMQDNRRGERLSNSLAGVLQSIPMLIQRKRQAEALSGAMAQAGLPPELARYADPGDVMQLIARKRESEANRSASRQEVEMQLRAQAAAAAPRNAYYESEARRKLALDASKMRQQKMGGFSDEQTARNFFKAHPNINPMDWAQSGQAARDKMMEPSGGGGLSPQDELDALNKESTMLARSITAASSMNNYNAGIKPKASQSQILGWQNRMGEINARVQEIRSGGAQQTTQPIPMPTQIGGAPIQQGGATERMPIPSEYIQQHLENLKIMDPGDRAEILDALGEDYDTSELEDLLGG